ncbi:MAG: hypothetical protein JWM78_3489 [Verrucomicrobiaceae bacterium]|nr:hypothetical protein [Verrucomicrobiaceae bacterium]
MKKKLITFIYFLAAASICSAGEEQIKLKDALSSFRANYSAASNHKAFAQSAQGAWAWSVEKADAQDAIDDAIAKCTSYLKPNQGPCMAIHVDNEWIPMEKIEQQKLAFYHANQVNAERAGIITLASESVKHAIESSKGRLAVQFSSYDHGCGYCVLSNVPVENLVPSYFGAVKFARITWQPWAKMDMEIVNYYHIAGLPTLIVFNDGKEEFRITGWNTSQEKEAREKLDACCAH